MRHININVEVDGTDHLDFYCPECGGPMKVKKVATREEFYHNCFEKCTFITLGCECGVTGQRKFYWGEENGKKKEE